MPTVDPLFSSMQIALPGTGVIDPIFLRWLEQTRDEINTSTDGVLLAANNLNDVGDVATSRTNLGLGSIATQAASSVAITGGTVTGITNLGVSGTLRANVTTVTTTSHTAGNEFVIRVDDDTAGAAVTVTLPTSVGNSGLMYHVKKLGTTANVVVDGDGSETIDGSTSITISTQYESRMLISNGTGWDII